MMKPLPAILIVLALMAFTMLMALVVYAATAGLAYAWIYLRNKLERRKA